MHLTENDISGLTALTMRAWMWLALSQTVLVSAERPRHGLLHTRGSKTYGVNGGDSIFFDSSSGEFKRSGQRMIGSAEVIKRTPIRTFAAGTVNKVLKRRKKYRRVPGKQNNKSEKESKKSEEELSFPKLPPLKAKYKTSDSIRMHLRRPDEDNLLTANDLPARESKVKAKISRPSKTSRIKPLELSDNFMFRKKMRQSEHPKAESREDKTYKYFDQQEEVLLTSGYHHQLRIQDPAYDYTIGGKYYVVVQRT